MVRPLRNDWVEKELLANCVGIDLSWATTNRAQAYCQRALLPNLTFPRMRPAGRLGMVKELSLKKWVSATGVTLRKRT